MRSLCPRLESRAQTVDYVLGMAWQHAGVRGIVVRSRAFTLVELVMSLAVTSILIAALGSAVVLISRTFDPQAAVGARQSSASRVLDQISCELLCAISIEVAEPRDLSFTLMRAGAPVSVRYTWTGVDAAPLLRTFDGQPAVAILNSVSEWRLVYDTVSITADPPPLEGGEVVVVQEDDTTSTGTGSHGVAIDYYPVEMFFPNLGADTTSWRPTRVKFMGRRQGNGNGVFEVVLHEVDAATQTPARRIEGVSVLESDLVADAWHEVVFTTNEQLDPTVQFAVSFEPISGTGVMGKIDYGTGSTFTPATKLVEHDTGSWTELVGLDLKVWLFAVPTVPDLDPPPSSDARLTAVSLTLGETPDSTLQTRVNTFNYPMLPVVDP